MHKAQHVPFNNMFQMYVHKQDHCVCALYKFLTPGGDSRQGAFRDCRWRPADSMFPRNEQHRQRLSVRQ